MAGAPRRVEAGAALVDAMEVRAAARGGAGSARGGLTHLGPPRAAAPPPRRRAYLQRALRPIGPPPTPQLQAYENLGRIGEVRDAPGSAKAARSPAAAASRPAGAAGNERPPTAWPRPRTRSLPAQGTFGTVLKCRNRETGEIVAIKKFKARIDAENDDAAQVGAGCWGAPALPRTQVGCSL